MKDNEIEELARFTTLADEIMGIEKWAEKRPDSITAYFLQKARTTLWSQPSRSRAVIDEGRALLNGAAAAIEEDGAHPIVPKGKARPAKQVTKTGIQDFRRIRDWCVELLNWGVSHNGIIDLNDYREKFIKDYPGSMSSRTRYGQGINELKRLRLIESAGRRKYTVKDSGRRFLADNMNTPATNTPTPPPQPPPPTDYGSRAIRGYRRRDTGCQPGTHETRASRTD